MFATWLEGPGFADAFDLVVFAVFDRSSDRSTLHAFQSRLTAEAIGDHEGVALAAHFPPATPTWPWSQW